MPLIYVMPLIQHQQCLRYRLYNMSGVSDTSDTALAVSQIPLIQNCAVSDGAGAESAMSETTLELLHTYHLFASETLLIKKKTLIQTSHF
jgi:hypothetical protein